MCLAASVAKRIINTAPIAKFGATGGANDSVHAGAQAAQRVLERGVRPCEVDEHVGVS